MARVNRRQHGEGSLYQRDSDGRWVAEAWLGYKDGKPDRRYFYGDTADEARLKREDFLAKRRGGFTLPKGRPPTVGEWAHHWLYNEIRGEVQDTTWPTYRSKTEHWIIPYFARTPLTNDAITEEAIKEWHAHLKREGVSGTSAQHCHRLLSQILKLAVIRGRLARNPAATTTAPARTTAEIMPPERDEVEAILTECENRRSGPRWITGLATGARAGEILGLLWPCADLDEGAVSIEWELVRLPWSHGCEDPRACSEPHHRRPCPVPCPKAARKSGRKHACVTGGGRGRDDHGNMLKLCPPDCTGHAVSCPQRTGGGLVLKRPKSAKSRRVVPVGRSGVAALRRQRQMQLEERLAVGPDWTGWAHSCDARPRRRDVVCADCRAPFRPDALVFSQRNGRPVDPRADWDDWLELLEAAGVDRYRRHDGRHYAATSLLEGAVDIRVVQELLGHATPDFTRRAYQHVRPALARDAAEVLDRALRGGRR